MHINPDLPCDNQSIVSKQTTTSRKGHRSVNRLTRSCTGRWKKYRTKYQYDSLGQVTGGNKYWSDETPVAGQQFDYTFDTIGNRTQTLSGGDQNGGYLRLANYSANNLNQLTNCDVPGYVDVKGVSFATNTVTVSGQTAYRKVEYFRDELAVNNSSSALWTNIIVTATGQSSQTGNVFVAQEPETFKYDTDGNLTNDGRWAYTWDAENRLIGMTNNTGVGPQYKLTFAYDSQGRRIQKIVATNGVAIYTNNCLYDGWNLVAETTPGNSLIRSYMWGTDLSGSPQGAGGVGGLLEVSYYGSTTTNCFPAYDGNGNVAALVNAADGTTVANYEYGPFGEVIRSTGPMARNNPLLFSTKYYDLESGLYYYGYRFYNPSTGIWPNRDPMQEQGGLNLYGFVGNSPINYVDPFGLLLSATGGSPETSPWRHHSFLHFKVTCPKCSQFVFDHVDYGAVAPGLLAAGFTSSEIAAASPLGGYVGAVTPNCNGDPVTVTVHMRTRFTNWPEILATLGNGLYIPNPIMLFMQAEDMASQGVAAYVAGTTIYYDCKQCGSN
jgi:RHS repeat-associated protein